MKFKLHIHFFIGLLWSAQALMAVDVVVVGYVFDKATKTPLEGVNIYLKDTDFGTTTDEDGFYLLKAESDAQKVVFSSMGYKTQEFNIEPGAIADIRVEMREDINFLKEIFIMPGKNPALDLMNRVKKAKQQNDAFNQPLQFHITDQQVVLLTGDKDKHKSIAYFDSKLDGLPQEDESTIAEKILPLYLSKETWSKVGNAPAQSLHKEAKASPENMDVVFEQLTGSLHSDLNFYHNTIVIFGKHFISPLANNGQNHYRYYLIDSIQTDAGKTYYLRFKSKNQKSLAFNGEMWIDAAHLALTKINLQLPAQANLNFLKKMVVSGQYTWQDEGVWLPEMTTLSFEMAYQLLADSSHLSPNIYLEKRLHTALTDVDINENDYAGSTFSKEELELKLAEMNDLPIMRTAQWLAHSILTGYIPAGKIDIGKLYQLARLSEIEGLRISAPLRTNANLWKNVELGGYWGYGFRNKTHSCSGYASWKLPIPGRTILSGGYTQDLRRIDYDYNDFLLREKPLLSGDEDITSTIFSGHFTDQIHPRKEWYLSATHEWNRDIESKLFLRRNEYFSNEALPFVHNGEEISSILQQAINFTTRFSYREKTYEDHLNRIYIHNQYPVLYLNLSAGSARLNQNNHPYGRIDMQLNHELAYSLGSWNYRIEAGWLWGKLPYNLLWMPQGNDSFYYKRHFFNLMDYREYALDKYISVQQEWLFNGFIFNHIPLIRLLNLREMLSLKCLYGGTNDKHAQLMDFPAGTNTMRYPYTEIGIGITNFMRILTIQAVWRLSETDKPDIRKFGIMGGVRFNL